MVRQGREMRQGGGVALAAESARWPFGELCSPAECAPHRPNWHLPWGKVAA